MPPNKKDKKKHYRGKTFTKFEDPEDAPDEDTRDLVAERNRRRGESPGSSSSEEEEEEVEEKGRKSGKGKGEDDDDDGVAPFQMERLNAGGGAVEGTDGPNLTSRQRKELEAQRKREAYQRLHAAGKTDEAKADLARLARIKEEREKKRKEREAAEEAEALKRKQTSAKAESKKEFVANLGGVQSSKLDKKKKKKEKKESKDGNSSDDEDSSKKGKGEVAASRGATNYYTSAAAGSGGGSAAPAPESSGPGRRHQDQALGMYSDYSHGDAPRLLEKGKENVGTIEACRAEEEDFM